MPKPATKSGAPPAASPSRRPAEANGSAPETPESLDQVRDILFGGQMRMVENRLRGIEERLFQELGALGEKLEAERTRRAEELKSLGAELKEALRGLEKRHAKLEEVATLSDAELRDQILRQSAAQGAELTRVAQQLGAALEKSSADLSARKLDITALAAILGDAAQRLTGEAKPPARGGGKG